MKKVVIQFIDGTGFDSDVEEVWLNENVLHVHAATGAYLRLNWSYVTMFSEREL